MGNREALLAGAKVCLLRRGYAQTTARDVAAESGVSLAAIGYHFGSLEVLLNAALVEAIDEWGEQLRTSLEGQVDSDAVPIERFEATWTRIIDSFNTHRPLWAASFEVFAQIDRIPAVRRALADALEQGRHGLAELFGGSDPAVEEQCRGIGSFYQALMTGVLAQWLTDPERAPSGRDLAHALSAALGDNRPPTMPTSDGGTVASSPT